MKILVTPTSLQPGKNEEALSVLREFAEELVFNTAGKPLSEEELLPLLKDCDGYIAGLDEVTERVMAECPRLKVISRYGAGYDRVDIKAARQYGIKVTNTPGVNAQAVGELAFGLILGLARKIPYLSDETRKGAWVRSTGVELKGKTLGILGFGMEGLAYDPYINEKYCSSHAIEAVSFEELMSRSNVVSLHLPLLESTYHLIDREAIARLPEGAILVNASRGGIVDEDAAYESLKSGKLFGLGLDAFETEPPKASKLFEFDNVIATPHTGAHTREATANMAELSIRNLMDVLSGRECPFVVS